MTRHPDFLSTRRLFPLLLGCLLAACPIAAQGPVSPPEYRELARELLRELIEIDTNVDGGNITAAAEAMAARLRAAGFPEEHILVDGPTPTKGNLVVRYPGRDPNLKPLLALAHIDVVAADPADWTIPPFEFLERDGYFWGRGVTDDKDEAAIYTAILIRMKREGFVPDRDIIMALTADEEGGGHNGVRWLLDNRPELVDAAYALNEGGGGILVDGVPLSNTVQASEKKVQNFRIEAFNPGGHSSRPRPDNAIYELSEALVGIGGYHFPVRLNEVTRAFFTRSANLEEGETAEAMRRIVADPSDREAAVILARDPRYNAMLRTTCVATVLEGGHATNALPQRATANVNCRVLPDETPEEILAGLRAAVGDADVEVIMQGQARNSPPSPLVNEVLGPIERLTEAMWPGVPVVPTMSTGATDGLYLRNAGIPVYGVSGLFYGDTNSHGMNERIPVKSFYDGLEFLDRLTRALATGGVS